MVPSAPPTWNPTPFLRSVLGGPAVAPDSIEALAGASRTYTLPGGAWVWRQGDPPAFFLALVRGLVKVCRALPNGNVAALGLFGPRDPLGVLAAVDGVPYPADALVISKSAEILAIPMEVLHHRLAVDPALGRALLACISTRVRGLHQKLVIVSSGQMPARLAALVLSLLDRFGDEGESGWFVPIELTRKTLAELIEARTETVIRLVSGWQAEGLLQMVPGGIEVPHPEALRALVEAG